MFFFLNAIGELAFIGGIVLNLWAYLSPTPWHSNDPTASMLRFKPYNEPVGYVPSNPCSSSPLSNQTVSITYGGPTNSVNYSNIAVWMGPLGSCSRDEDGAVHCTKPSFKNPQFNMTYVQPNSALYPQNMPGKMSGASIHGLTIFHCVELFLFLVGSIGFWTPVTWSRVFGTTKPTGPVFIMASLAVVMGLAAIVEFFFNFAIGVGHLGAFNSIDNFYDPAPCNQVRPLKSGILLVAEAGKMYQMMWVSWVLIYVISGVFLLGRIAWTSSKFEELVKNGASARAVRDVERSAAKVVKDQEKFRVKVEKEKDRIRSVALQELKVEEQSKAKAEEANMGIEKSSTFSSSEDGAPPYDINLEK